MDYEGAKSQAECKACPTGSFCTPGSQAKQECPYGFGCPPGATVERSECAPGYYSLHQSSLQQPCAICPPAHFCPPRSMKAFPCEPGTYGLVEGWRLKEQCMACPKGKACPNAGTTDPIECLDGHYCPQGTESPGQFPCPYGTYAAGVRNLAERDACAPCPAGYFCHLGAFDLPQTYKCPPGHFCAGGNSYPYVCIGGYNPDYAASECIVCPAGYYCAFGARTPILCPKGSYCPEGTVLRNQHLCPPGTYQPTYGASDDSSCLQVTARHYSSFGDGWPKLCPYGHICAEGSHFPTISSDPGYFAPEASKEQFDCPAGTYSTSAQTVCLTCPAGYYCDQNTELSFLRSMFCPAGKYCPQSSQNPDGACGRDKVCLKGTPLPSSCPSGTQAPDGATSREQCSGGGAGSFIPAMTSLNRLPLCEPGYYCTSQAFSPYQHKCPAGTYLPSKGGTSLADCLSCPTGSLCPAGSVNPQPCPEGFACSGGIATACEKGTF